MPVDTQNEHIPYPHLQNDAIAYRSAISPAHIDRRTGELVWYVFMRRPPTPEGRPRDVEGLSVHLNCGVEDIVDTWKKSPRKQPPLAIGELVVGNIREVASASLEVIQNKPHHGNITGLPVGGEDDAKAERLARELAKICHRVYP